MTRTHWWRRAAFAVVAFAVLYPAFVKLDFEPDALRLGLLIVLAVSLAGVLSDALVGESPHWDVDSTRAATGEGLDRRTARFLGLLESHLTARTPDGALGDRLLELADLALRQRHHVGVRERAARDLLGPDLCRILDEPPRRLSRAEITRCVTRIEEL